jgi:WD40 repeat protein
MSTGGRLLAAGSQGGDILVWDASSGERVARLRHASLAARNEVFAVEFTHDVRCLLSAGRDGRVIVWDTRTWSELLVLDDHLDYVYSLAFSPDGRRLATGSGDLTIRLHGDYTLDALEQARSRRTALLDEASPLVDAWLESETDASAVAARARRELAKRPDLLEVARQVLLARAMGTGE